MGPKSQPVMAMLAGEAAGWSKRGGWRGRPDSRQGSTGGCGVMFSSMTRVHPHV